MYLIFHIFTLFCWKKIAKNIKVLDIAQAEGRKFQNGHCHCTPFLACLMVHLLARALQLDSLLPPPNLSLPAPPWLVPLLPGPPLPGPPLPKARRCQAGRCRTHRSQTCHCRDCCNWACCCPARHCQPCCCGLAVASPGVAAPVVANPDVADPPCFWAHRC